MSEQKYEEDAGKWAGLKRLIDGVGMPEDAAEFARDFIDHHLEPEKIHLATRLWITNGMRKLLAGEETKKAFKVRKHLGTKFRVTASQRAVISAYLELRKRSGLSYDDALAETAAKFHKDTRNIEKTVIKNWARTIDSSILETLLTNRR